MERIVIWLISMEIVLSLLFGFLGVYEGYQQSKILDHMDASTSNTASAMKAASASLNTLAEDQATSLERLKQMNESLQSSLRQTGTMTTATQQQLSLDKASVGLLLELFFCEVVEFFCSHRMFNIISR
jgi:glutamate-1-semialdehyde aminotransferase